LIAALGGRLSIPSGCTKNGKQLPQQSGDATSACLRGALVITCDFTRLQVAGRTFFFVMIAAKKS
jgi:hypothetical protein